MPPVAPMDLSNPQTSLDNLLNNDDVLMSIFDFFKVENIQVPEEISVARKTLSSAARCCKALTEPALDALWHTLPSMLPLLHLLPSFQVYEGVYIIDELNSDEWTLYDRYSKRVRRLVFENPPPNTGDVKVSPLVYIQLMQMHPVKTLPNIRFVEVPPRVFVEPLLLLHLFSMHTDSVVFNDDVSLYTRQIIPSLLATLQASSPHLQKLELKGPSNINLDPVFGLKRLSSLDLSFPGTYLFPSSIQALGALEHLRSLTLHVGTANPVSPPIQRTYSRIRNSTIHPFVSLHHLSLIGHPILVGRVFDNIDSPNLRSLHIHEEQTSDQSPTLNSWQMISSRISGAPQLESIHFNQCSQRPWGHPNYSLSSQLLLQLVDFPCARTLHTFIIEQGCISINDADIATFTTAFKNLKTLILPIETYERCPTIASIAHIATACPRLEVLQFPILCDVNTNVTFIEAHLSNFWQTTAQHPLRSLTPSVGIYSEIQTKPDVMIVFAEFIHQLFPKLTLLKGWTSVEKMVLALRRARMAGAIKC